MIFRLSSAYKSIIERKIWDPITKNDDVKDDLKQALGIIHKSRRREENQFTGFSDNPSTCMTYLYYMFDRMTIGFAFLVESLFDEF